MKDSQRLLLLGVLLASLTAVAGAQENPTPTPEPIPPQRPVRRRPPVPTNHPASFRRSGAHRYLLQSKHCSDRKLPGGRGEEFGCEPTQRDPPRVGGKSAGDHGPLWTSRLLPVVQRAGSFGRGGLRHVYRLALETLGEGRAHASRLWKDQCFTCMFFRGRTSLCRS